MTSRVLLPTGTLDPITRPETARSVQALFPRSRYSEFLGFGHGILRAKSSEPLPRCAMQLVAAFLDEPLSPPDASCVAALPSLAF